MLLKVSFMSRSSLHGALFASHSFRAHALRNVLEKPGLGHASSYLDRRSMYCAQSSISSSAGFSGYKVSRVETADGDGFVEVDGLGVVTASSYVGGFVGGAAEVEEFEAMAFLYCFS